MGWTISELEFESVICLPDADRYSYFVKRAADRGKVWSLWAKGGWMLVGTDTADECVPVWPHERFAEAYASSIAGSGFEAKAIELDSFRSRWIPGMTADNRMVAVFPTPQQRGVVVAPERLRRDLDGELALYE